MRRGVVLLIGVAAVAMTLLGATSSAPGGMARYPRFAITDSGPVRPPTAVIAGRPKHAKCSKPGSWTCSRGQGQGGTPPACRFGNFFESVERSGGIPVGGMPPLSVDSYWSPEGNLQPGSLLLVAFATPGGTVTAPAGWTEVPADAGSSATGERLQLFYKIPLPLSNLEKGVPLSWRFKSSDPQATYFEEMLFDGVSQSDPVSAAGVAASMGPSVVVTVPSITPTTANSMLVFVGAVGSPEHWTAPSGMTAVEGQEQKCGFGSCHAAPHTLELAYRRWGSPTPTGARAAAISGAAESTSELIALNIPGPSGCPRVQLLNPRGGLISPHRRVPLLSVAADGRVPVLLKCDWSRRCDGSVSFAPAPFGEVFAGHDFAMSAGQRRTVRVPVCAPVTRCPAIGGPPTFPRRARDQPVQVVIQVLRPNGQALTQISNAELAFP